MTIRKSLVKRQIGDDIILVPVGDASLELCGLLTLNESGELLWDRLPDAPDADALVQALLDEYDTDASTARADVAAFLSDLQCLGII